MRVCLGTNVLASAFATRGLCTDLLRLVLAEHSLVCGEVILEELERVLLKRFRMTPRVTTEVLELLRDRADVIPRPALPAHSSVRDADDEWIVATALAGQAEVLVTGDKDLLAPELATGLKICNPRDFWRHIQGKSV